MPEPPEGQLVAIAIQNYLTNTEKVSKDERSKNNKITDRYAKTTKHSFVIKQIFSSFKKKLNKHSFTTTCKRFLILLDQILEQSCVRSSYKPYADLISDRLIDCFVHVFSLIFHYQMLEDSLDWKVYRMLWAKTIKDNVFDALRAQIAQKHRNFDLNKGFTQESIERIKKRYARKKFTDEEIKRYMEANKKQIKRQPAEIPRPASNITNTRQASESSSSYEELQPQKKVRKNSISHTQPLKREVAPSYHPYGQTDKSSYTAPFPHDAPPYLVPPSAPLMNPYLGYNQPNGLYHPSYPHQANGSFASKSPYRSPYHSPYRSPEPSSYQANHKKSKSSMDDSNSMENHVVMRKELFDNLKECRECGLKFQSRDNLKKHQQKHLVEAQHELQLKQCSKASQNQMSMMIKMQDDHRLCSISEWKQGFRKNQETTPQQIAIQSLPVEQQKKNSYCCFFCQEELRIRWCPALQDWALDDSVKINKNERIEVAHLSCYTEFVPGESKSEEEAEIP